MEETLKCCGILFSNWNYSVVKLYFLKFKLQYGDFFFFNQSWSIMEFHQSVCYGFWFFKLKLKCCGINPVAVGTSGDFSTTPNWSGKGSKKIPTSCCVAASASSYAAPTSCTVNVASGTYQTQVWCFAFSISVCIDRVGRAHAVIKETCDG